jgi:hypothetical protein
MAYVSITRLRIRSWRYLPSLFWYAFLSKRQFRASPGNLAADALMEARMTFWTRSVWADENAMRTFRSSGAHRKVMPRLLDWCDEASVAHWQQDSSEPPKWHEAHQRMQREGRRSKVRNPSDAHKRFEITAPQIAADA